MFRILLRACILLLAGCVGLLAVLAHGDEDHADDAVEAPEIHGLSLPAQPTYHEHVRPIMEASCVDCHAEGQIAGYAPLTEARFVAFAADDVAWHVTRRIMPPWPPSRENLPLRHDRSLSDYEIALIAAWVDAGAQLGEPEAYAPAATDAVAIPPLRPDMILQLEAPYAPAADVKDDYRCFALKLAIDKPMFVTAYEFIPDATEMAHHAIFYVADAAAEGEIARRDKADGRPGWTCYGDDGLSGRSDSFGGWAPGGAAVHFPAGTGYRILPGQHLVLQMHYNLSAVRQRDQSRVVLQLADGDSGLDELMLLAMTAPVEIPCPPGVEGPECERGAALERLSELYGRGSRRVPDAVLRSCRQSLDDYADNTGVRAIGSCDYPVRWDLTLFGALGHMHELGTRYRLELLRGDESAFLLDIPRWDFHWQDHYQFVTPLELAPGDALRMTCEWDNRLSKAPRYVVWGEGTSDEMCFGMLLAKR